MTLHSSGPYSSHRSISSRFFDIFLNVEAVEEGSQSMRKIGRQNDVQRIAFGSQNKAAINYEHSQSAGNVFFRKQKTISQ